MKSMSFFGKSQRFILIFLLLTQFIAGFSSASQVFKIRKSFEFFPEISGWRKSKEIRIYTPETLYKYINGAAELYLSYGFQELQVGEYFNKNDASIIVEIYRHKTPLLAFGIYSQERPVEGNFLKIGAQAYIEPPILNFVTGNIYVKINGYDTGVKTFEVLQDLAKRIADNIGGKDSLPKILDCFPGEGKKQNSEKFISKSFLGYNFLHSGFTADYKVNNSTFKLFIIVGRNFRDSKEMLRKYMKFTKCFQKDLRESSHIVLSDPYHGKVALSWRGKYIWGVLNLDEENLRREYLRLMDELLEKYEQSLIK